MKSTKQWKELFAQFHCMIMKMEISILHHVIVNSQLYHDNLTRRYINCDIVSFEKLPNIILLYQYCQYYWCITASLDICLAWIVSVNILFVQSLLGRIFS